SKISTRRVHVISPVSSVPARLASCAPEKGIGAGMSGPDGGCVNGLLMLESEADLEPHRPRILPRLRLIVQAAQRAILRVRQPEVIEAVAQQYAVIETSLSRLSRGAVGAGGAASRRIDAAG